MNPLNPKTKSLLVRLVREVLKEKDINAGAEAGAYLLVMMSNLIAADEECSPSEVADSLLDRCRKDTWPEIARELQGLSKRSEEDLN